MSNSITHQNQFENQELDAYGSSMRHNNAFPEALGAFPSIGVAEGSAISHTRHLMDLLGAANESNHHQPRGLSLSLGSHMLVPSDEYRNHQRPLNPGLINPNFFMSGQEAREACNPPLEHLTGDYFFNTGTGTYVSSSSAPLNRSPNSTSYVPESFASVIGNSRYLKPVQSLLEDLVDVGGNVADRINEKYVEKMFRGSRGGARILSSELKTELRNNGPLLADKHEHHIKIARLISLLDKVVWFPLPTIIDLDIPLDIGFLNLWT
ncbi:unnamed protein product [Sphenostylis stenocarpa]|uniref:POX domain-containing protein n=1 Tax=Sphenostylis stenocarpa TaxID=92480 RepID=A0AA86SV01_9FABA|nr:unnamed protein product [Sphenostylis stenocarpa]